MKPIPLKREVKKCENALDFTMLPLFKTFFFLTTYILRQENLWYVYGCVYLCPSMISIYIIAYFKILYLSKNSNLSSKG